MSNRIDELLSQLKKSEKLTVPQFAKKCGLPATTIYGIRSRKTMENISIDVFLKIAEGFGMTAEELYYGTKPERTYRDSRQRTINEVYETVSEAQKDSLCEIAQNYALAHSKSAECGPIQTA